MRQITIATNAYCAFKLGNVEILELLQHTDIIKISPIVIGELLAGFSRGSKAQQNRQELAEFLACTRCETININEETAIYYAKIYTQLRKKAKPIPTNDLWLAASTVQHGAMLCTLDKHFDDIAGLVTCSSQLDVLT